MLKNLSQIEIALNDKVYRIVFDIDTKLTDLKEAIFQLQKYVGRIEDTIIAQEQERKKQEEKKIEEPIVEEFKPE